MSELFVEPAATPEAQADEGMEQQEKGSMQAEDAGAFAVSAGDFSALEERVVRAVALVKQERQARGAAEERAALAQASADERAATIEQMEAELTTLRSERDHVRRRVESLLQQLDALEL
jgi:chromosome segregation ATPase